ncbi:MAG: outer membrane lipoprotein-sorting protein [Spirochaetia bacterium]|mgnify:CR=1 FL=1|nr:outer membrane lipoprotein-sorting protein [Spirochaetia bacterium]
MKRFFVTMVAAAAAFSAFAQAAPTAAEILAKVDANEKFSSIEYEGRMELVLAGKTRVKTMKAVALGADKAFIEFTNPEDRGVRYLKLGDELWMYFPKEDDTVKISGHLLREGMMGSDVSYEEALESDSLSEIYDAVVKGREDYEGRPVWVLELAAKKSSATYARQILRVDAERYVTLSAELYAKSGKLLKISRTLEVRLIGTRWYPVKVELSDKLRKDSRTTFELVSIKLDVPVDPKRFSLSELGK